jgi:hypothetical protein
MLQRRTDMGVESYYDSQASQAWVGKTITLPDGKEGVVKGIRQTDGFTNPAMDYDFCLVLEDGSEVPHWNVKEKKPALPHIEDYEFEKPGAYIRVSIDPENMDEKDVEKVRKVLDALGLLED